jgi:hypothetical protein
MVLDSPPSADTGKGKDGIRARSGGYALFIDIAERAGEGYRRSGR